MSPNNSEAQKEPGGPHILPHSRTIIRSRGANSAPPSAGLMCRKQREFLDL
jgi:hypothetical protein